MGKKLLSRAAWYSGPLTLALGVGLMADGMTVQHFPIMNGPNKEYITALCLVWPYWLDTPEDMWLDSFWTRMIVDLKTRGVKS